MTTATEERTIPDGADVNSIELGDLYVDTITGFKGKVIGRADYITGCAQALLSALVQGRVESAWFDYPRLAFYAAAPTDDLSHDPAARRTGGPTPSASLAAPRP